MRSHLFVPLSVYLIGVPTREPDSLTVAVPRPERIITEGNPACSQDSLMGERGRRVTGKHTTAEHRAHVSSKALFDQVRVRVYTVPSHDHRSGLVLSYQLRL